MFPRPVVVPIVGHVAIVFVILGPIGVGIAPIPAVILVATVVIAIAIADADGSEVDCDPGESAAAGSETAAEVRIKDEANKADVSSFIGIETFRMPLGVEPTRQVAQ